MTLTIRLVCYVIAIVAGVAMAGRLLVVQARLAKLLAAIMIAWALNAALFLVLLLYRFQGILDPPWTDAAFTANAIILAACPVILYLRFTSQHMGDS